MAAGRSISVEGSTAFNTRFPMGVPTTTCGEGNYQEKGIYMYSFSGTQAVTNILDPLDPLFAGTSLIVDIKGDNDGMVSRCSAKFGRTIRDRLQPFGFSKILYHNRNQLSKDLEKGAIYCKTANELFEKSDKKLEINEQF